MCVAVESGSHRVVVVTTKIGNWRADFRVPVSLLEGTHERRVPWYVLYSTVESFHKNLTTVYKQSNRKDSGKDILQGE